jgi:SAM-dependent methyltransferase
MLFSLANLKKRSVRDPDGEQAVMPKLLHGRAALKLLDQAISVFDGQVGRPRNEYDGRDLEAVMGDYRLGRCVEACLLTRYSFVQPQLAGVISPEYVAALTEKGLAEPSAWLVRWVGSIPAGGLVLDLAAGRGRHSRWLASRGHTVDAVDRDAQALSTLAGSASVRTLCADVENAPWPISPGAYAGVVVTNYLHRPLFPDLLAALGPAGAFIYETFALGNERFGRPSNPDFLLRPGELLEVVRGRLRVVAYEDGYVEAPKPARVQRICAVGPDSDVLASRLG